MSLSSRKTLFIQSSFQDRLEPAVGQPPASDAPRDSFRDSSRERDSFVTVAGEASDGTERAGVRIHRTENSEHELL